jgi:hypothetical protein
VPTVFTTTADGWKPFLFQNASWIPVSEVADVLSAIVRAPETPAVVHVSRPHPVSWATLMQPVADTFGVPMVSWEKWLEALDNSMNEKALSVRDQRRVEPAIRLRSVFHARGRVFSERGPGMYEAFGLPNSDTTVMCKLVPALETATPLGKEDVESWMGYWRKMDML